MFMDFIGVCLDQIVNQAAKMKYMFGGSVSVPLTITTASGAGLGAAAQHSQSLEAWLAHVPGLKVVMPCDAYTAKGLTVSAIRDDNPVVVMLNKVLLGSTSEVPEPIYGIPLGQAHTARHGSDVTVIALGRMVGEALAAADELAAEGVEVEVIDPRTVQPLDTEAMFASVRRTNRVLVVHEAVTFGGLGAEIAAQIQDAAFDHLDAPVLRIGAPSPRCRSRRYWRRPTCPTAPASRRAAASSSKGRDRDGRRGSAAEDRPDHAGGHDRRVARADRRRRDGGRRAAPAGHGQGRRGRRGGGRGLFHPVVAAGATVPAGALIGWLLAEGEQPPGAGRRRHRPGPARPARTRSPW